VTVCSVRSSRRTTSALVPGPGSKPSSVKPRRSAVRWIVRDYRLAHGKLRIGRTLRPNRSTPTSSLWDPRGEENAAAYRLSSASGTAWQSSCKHACWSSGRIRTCRKKTPFHSLTSLRSQWQESNSPTVRNLTEADDPPTSACMGRILSRGCRKGPNHLLVRQFLCSLIATANASAKRSMCHCSSF